MGFSNIYPLWTVDDLPRGTVSKHFRIVHASSNSFMRIEGETLEGKYRLQTI
jgi:hypothetical protein